MSLFDIEFIRIYAGELIKLIKEVNILFSKIAQEISIFAYQNGKEALLLIKYQSEDVYLFFLYSSKE